MRRPSAQSLAEGLGAATPEALPAAFMAAFNNGDFDAADRLFEPDAIRVMPDASSRTGADRLVPTRALYATRSRLDLRPSACFVADGVALLLTRSAITTASGDVSVGTAIDVARLTPAGTWAYLIDNPLAVGYIAT
ncbi:MAG: YybH family protein [Nocardioides sp.]